MNNFYHIIAELSHSFLLIEIINCFQRNLLFQLTVKSFFQTNFYSINSFNQYKYLENFLNKLASDKII